MNSPELSRYKRTEISKAGVIASMTPFTEEVVTTKRKKVTQAILDAGEIPVPEGAKVGDRITLKTTEVKELVKLTFYGSVAEVVVTAEWVEQNGAEVGLVYVQESTGNEICEDPAEFSTNYTVMPS